MKKKIYQELFLATLTFMLSVFSLYSQQSSLNAAYDESTDILDEKYNHELLATLYPNPVKEIATLNYTLPVDGLVTIQVFNSIGAIVNTLLNESKTNGKYSINFNVNEFPPGMYIAKIKLHTNRIDQVRVIRFIVSR
jgi:hypothetical protein